MFSLSTACGTMTALKASILLCMLGASWLAFSALANRPKMRVTAVVCLNRACTERGAFAFEPARIDVEAFVPVHTANRLLRLGLVCDGDPMLSQEDMDGQTDLPLYSRSYREVAAGECLGVAQVLRADGTHEAAQSVQLRVLSRF